MSLAAEAVRSLYGAYRLARRDPMALSYFDLTRGGAVRSFTAALLVAPFQFVMVLLGDAPQALGVSPFRFWAVHIITYVMIWTAFPLIMWEVTAAIGRRQRFFAYVTVYNWAAVLQDAAIILISVLSMLGSGGQPGPGSVLSIIVFGLVLLYLWYIARTALSVEAPIAVAIVVLDVVISFLIIAVSEQML